MTDRPLPAPVCARRAKEPLLKAAVHPRQTARLAALRDYDVLDTPRESGFDDIVRLASEICGTPISVVNLIDADRQWFKAEVGLGVRETPLDTSLCAHAILESDYLEIPDTLADTRMRDNALCTGEPGLRFYAGALLKTEDGLPVGTLCVLDYAPRTLTAFQRDALMVLSRQVTAQLNLRLALKRQTLLHQEIDHRVKNSLQSVAALVRLQMRQTKEPQVRAALESVEQRVRTIALIHGELYRANAAGEVDLAHYMASLRDMLQSVAPDNISISMQTHPLRADSSRASALGVIINEFVTNSTKYAFPDDRAGSIAIMLRPAAGNTLELLCEDDGVGAPADTGAGGLGMRLIEASAAQLGGHAEFLRDGPGFGLRVVFPA